MIQEAQLLRLESAIVRVWRIKLAIFGIVAVLGAAAYDIQNLFDQSRFLPLGVATGGAILLSIAAGWLLPRLWYRYWRYLLSEEELILKRGIVNRVTTIVPLRRVQHLDVSQDLVEREHALGKLIVHTAGTRSSEVILPGLLFSEAERLRDTIKLYISDEPV